MAFSFGTFGVNETDYQFITQLGQEVVYDWTQQYVQRINNDLNLAMGVFVEETTETFKERYLLPGGGYMQRRGGATNPGARKTTGKWDVGYPIESFGEVVAETRNAMAYMTPAKYAAHVNGVVAASVNTIRLEMLHKLLNNSQKTFNDENHGEILVEPLANGDTVVYPPVEGAVSEATEDHYLVSGYAASGIDNTNNPLPVIRDDLIQHYGRQTGGSNIVVFINPAQRAKIEALSGFIAIPDQYIRVGNDTDVPQGLPMVAGEIIGRSDGCWVVVWDYIPAAYMLGIHLEAPAPLKRRVHPVATGLPSGLALVAQDDSHPIESAEWNLDFGFGVGNRLNGVVMELTTDVSYTIPSAYDW